MTVLHCVAGLPRSGGGLSELVPRLAREMASAGHAVVLATVAPAGDRLSDEAEKAQRAGVCMARFAPSRPHFLFFSWPMLWGLRSRVKQADIVHVHSSWTFPVWWACFWAACLKKPFVMSPHGAFDPVRLAHSAWKKKWVGWVDRFFLRRAARVHATSEMERRWVERFVAGAVNVAIVPNGVELSQPHKGRDGGGKREGRRKVVLYLGRNHALKGLDLLEGAWGMAKREGWRLDLVGPGLPGGLVEGAGKWRVLRSADVLVLPTRSENFGIVVAEALAVGVPVVTTKGAPWAELVSERCGWWVDVETEALANALREAMDLTDEERRVMGENGRRLVERKYAWGIVAEHVEQVYRAVLLTE